MIFSVKYCVLPESNSVIDSSAHVVSLSVTVHMLAVLIRPSHESIAAAAAAAVLVVVGFKAHRESAAEERNLLVVVVLHTVATVVHVGTLIAEALLVCLISLRSSFPMQLLKRGSQFSI